MSLSSDYFDICIIGASIAGNYLCSLISKYDLKIAIIEEHTDIGQPLQCAGIVSKKLAQLIDLPNNLIFLRGTPLEPPLAGIIVTTQGFLFIKIE